MRLHMKTVEFSITGAPVPKGRPRMTSRGHAYTPQRTREAEQAIADAFRKLNVTPFADVAVSIRIDCVFAPPQSWSKRKQAAARQGAVKKTTKPDADNLAKTVCDALNGLAWDDDSQIVKLTVTKRYGVESYTSVKISEEAY